MHTETVTFEVGQCVSFWLGGRLGQVEDLHRTNVTVLYRDAGRLLGPLRRQRVAGRTLAMHQFEDPPFNPTPNPFGRAIVRRRAKTFTIESIDTFRELVAAKRRKEAASG